MAKNTRVPKHRTVKTHSLEHLYLRELFADDGKKALIGLAFAPILIILGVSNHGHPVVWLDGLTYFIAATGYLLAVRYCWALVVLPCLSWHTRAR